MTPAARTVQRTYLVLTLLTTLASSFIWGINTLFLLDAGLSNTEAFAANAFNGVIPSEQRATVLSFDSLVGSTGGVVAQPALGRVADVYGYGASYVVAGGALALALPFILLARRERAPSDPITDEAAEPVERSAA